MTTEGVRCRVIADALLYASGIASEHFRVGCRPTVIQGPNLNEFRGPAVTVVLQMLEQVDSSSPGVVLAQHLAAARIVSEYEVRKVS
jgi:hypothetical protein